MDNEQLDVVLASVLPRFGLQVRGIVPLDPNTWLVDGDERGLKRLRVDTDEAKVKRRHLLWEHLAKQGFRRIPRHIRTMYGEALIAVEDQIYTLSDDWEGRVPDIMPLDMRLVGRNLGHLHQAAKGLELEGELALPKRHGTWLERFAKTGDELQSLKDSWSENSLRLQTNPMQEVFFTHYDWLAEQIGAAVEGLSAGKYEELSRKSEQELEFAVGEYRLSDLRIDYEGKVATLNIDDCIADLPLYDAAKFAHQLMERGEDEMARTFLQAYAETVGLSQQEVVIINSYLTFPHAAYRHLAQFKRLKRGADVFAERLDHAVRSWQTRPILYAVEGVRWV